MLNRKYIRIEELCIQNGTRIVFRLSYPLRIKKYFLSDSLYVEYDKRIDNVDKSILNIPAVTTLALVAWAIGADIYVKELDETYIESLSRIKSIIKRVYPNFSFSTQINAEKVISNKFSNEGYALLFSGGLDATTSYIRHRSKKPQLISIWGNDILPKQTIIWEKCKKKITDFAEQEKVKTHFVKTNVHSFMYENLLSVEFGLWLWGRVSHGPTMLSLCAP